MEVDDFSGDEGSDNTEVVEDVSGHEDKKALTTTSQKKSMTSSVTSDEKSMSSSTTSNNKKTSLAPGKSKVLPVKWKTFRTPKMSSTVTSRTVMTSKPQMTSPKPLSTAAAGRSVVTPNKKAAAAAKRVEMEESRTKNLVILRQILKEYGVATDVLVAEHGHSEYKRLLETFELIISVLLRSESGQLQHHTGVMKQCNVINNLRLPDNKLDLKGILRVYTNMRPVVRYKTLEQRVILHPEVHRKWKINAKGEWLPKPENEDDLVSKAKVCVEFDEKSASYKPSEKRIHQGSRMAECSEADTRQNNSYILMDVMEKEYGHPISKMIQRQGRITTLQQLSLYVHVVTCLLKSKSGVLAHSNIVTLYDASTAPKIKGNRKHLLDPITCYGKFAFMLKFRHDNGSVALDKRFRNRVGLDGDSWKLKQPFEQAERKETLDRKRKFGETVGIVRPQPSSSSSQMSSARRTSDKLLEKARGMSRMRDLESERERKRPKIETKNKRSMTDAFTIPIPGNGKSRKDKSTNTPDLFAKIDMPSLFRCAVCEKVPNEHVVLDARCGKLVGCLRCFQKEKRTRCLQCEERGTFVVLKGLHRKLWQMR